MNKPNNYWTYENCKEEALKYENRNDFKLKSNGAYASSRRNGWLDGVCSHIINNINPRNFWTYERCKEEALKYETRSEFQHKCGSGYVRARVNNYLNNICSHMIESSKSLSEYTKEECMNEAQKYQFRKDFIKCSWSYYESARRNGYIKEICCNYRQKWAGYWNDIERCRTEALKHSSRKMFRDNCASAHDSALRNGWLDEICLHMLRKGNKMKRCIYRYIFTDNSTYVGLTHDLDERKSNRKKNTNDSVISHINKTKLTPKITQLTDYLPIDEAVKLEEEYRLKYIAEGWNVLNRVKCGSLGGNTLFWTYDKIIEVASECTTKKEFNEKYHGAYLAAHKIRVIDDVCSHMIPHIMPKEYWTYDNCEKEFLKYNTLCKLKKFRSICYKSALENDWIDKLSKHMLPFKKQNKFKHTYEFCEKITQTYDNYSSFIKNESTLLYHIVKNGWKDELTHHMHHIKVEIGYWNNIENCHTAALKYSNRTDFKKRNGSAYNIACKNGWLNNICSHMIRKTN